jgi:hypothetical protein
VQSTINCRILSSHSNSSNTRGFTNFNSNKSFNFLMNFDRVPFSMMHFNKKCFVSSGSLKQRGYLEVVFSPWFQWDLCCLVICFLCNDLWIIARIIFFFFMQVVILVSPNNTTTYYTPFFYQVTDPALCWLCTTFLIPVKYNDLPTCLFINNIVETKYFAL